MCDQQMELPNYLILKPGSRFENLRAKIPKTPAFVPKPGYIWFTKAEIPETGQNQGFG
jgi:hypothetical protein